MARCSSRLPDKSACKAQGGVHVRGNTALRRVWVKAKDPDPSASTNPLEPNHDEAPNPERTATLDGASFSTGVGLRLTSDGTLHRFKLAVASYKFISQGNESASRSAVAHFIKRLDGHDKGVLQQFALPLREATGLLVLE